MRAPEVTFDDARRLVRDHLLDRWRAQDGRLVVAEQGFQDATHWRVLANAVALEDPDDSADSAPPAVDLAGLAFLVDKSTGELAEVPVAGNEARWQAMLPWGPPS